MESDHACTSKQTKTIDFGSIFHRKKKTEDKRTNESKTFVTFPKWHNVIHGVIAEPFKLLTF